MPCCMTRARAPVRPSRTLAPPPCPSHPRCRRLRRPADDGDDKEEDNKDVLPVAAVSVVPDDGPGERSSSTTGSGSAGWTPGRTTRAWRRGCSSSRRPPERGGRTASSPAPTCRSGATNQNLALKSVDKF